MRDFDMESLSELVRSAKGIVENEGDIAEKTIKGEFDYATQVDIKVQGYLQAELYERYPDIQFMGEESASDGIDLDKPTWILDPIDGTTNLIHHFPQCAISLGLMVEREIVLGIVYNPFLNQMFTALKGKGAYRDGKKIHVSEVAALNESLVSVGTAPYQKELAAHDFGIMSEIFRHCQDIRRVGAAALDFAYVACGITDAFYERTLKPWDYAAGKLICEEAGGRTSTLAGEAIPVGLQSGCLVTNGHIHDEMLGYTRRILG